MLKKLIRFTLALSIFASTALLAGTTGKIAGTVKDAATGEPLPGANIVLENTNLGGATDIEGHFFIINIPPGRYRVQATMIGFASTIMADVRVKIDQTTQINFSLNSEVLEGQEVTIVAERPKVELDLTASKQTMTDDQISNSWGIDIKEVISDLPGVNINGGIRGGFGLHEAYHLDGMDMRDIGSNTNFNTVNLSTIKEVEVLTGGYNAEYGRANGAIMNIVTKTASDRIHGTVRYRMRPTGVYHWGSNVYGDDTFQKTVMTTKEFWDPNSQWQSQWMDTPQDGFDGDFEPFVNWTPEERAEFWKKFVNDENFNPQMDYADRMEWETETTLYGPITRDLGFMVSARYKEGVSKFPSALKYNPDMTLQGSLNYRLSTSTKLDVMGVYTQFENSGASRTNFGSTEDTFHNNSAFPFVRTPYDYRAMYWMWGAYSSSSFGGRAPEYTKFFNMQGKLTHTFSPNTFLEVALQHSRMDYEMHYRDIMKTAFYTDLGFEAVPQEYPYTSLPKSIYNYKFGMPGDVWQNFVDTKNTTLKADLTSQLTKHHQLKFGGLFSYQYFNKILHDTQGSAESLEAQLTDLSRSYSNPYEGAFYIQDKMEFEGMVINAGVRVDFFDANKTISSTIYDPLMLSDSTEGHTGPVGIIAFDPDGSGPGYVDTPTQWAVSPRFGISHPISENTVLHFMYGDFYQRPPWQKIAGPYNIRVQLPSPEEGGTSDINLNPDSTQTYYNFYTHSNPNPGLTWEKMTQWEVGVEQNIADMFSFDVTMYYRNAHDLTSRGLHQGPNNLNISSTGGRLFVELFGDPNSPAERQYGQTIGYYYTPVNGAWSQVRGIEATLGTKFRYINVNANYTLSFLTNGVYHYNKVYGYYPDMNTFSGPNNSDSGRNGSDDDSWQPHNSAFLKISMYTPENFGPQISYFHPFANWLISTSTTWSQGQIFTWYPNNVPEGEREPNNRRWKDRWNTNMNISRTIGLFHGMKAKFSANIKNVFNQSHLKRFSGDDLDRYMQEGLKPIQDKTKEPLVWEWYYNLPREIYFGLTFEF